MTRIITSDKRTRVHAIPLRASWYTDLVGATVGAQLLDGNADGDLKNFADGGSAQVRIPVPAKGDLIEARLFLNAVSHDTGFTELAIYIGDWDTDGITPKTLTMTEILRRHQILTGYSSAFFYSAQDNMFIDGLNLMPLIPKRGEVGYNEDGFILGLYQVSKDPPTNYVLFDFNVDMSVQIAEVKK